MAKLADIDSKIRTFGKIATVGGAGLILLFMIIIGGQFIKNVFFPTPPPPPQEKFGTLPHVSFPGQESRNLNYTVNTLSGTLPENLGDRMIVYKLKEPEATLVALKNARDALAGAGYDLNEAKLSPTIYRWSDRVGTMIEYNIINKNFKINSDFLNLPPQPLSGFGATSEGAYSTATDFLQSIDEDVKHLDQEKSKVTYLRNDDSKLVAAASQNEAEFIKIDLFQKNLNEIPVYYPGLNQSSMYFVFRTEGTIPVIVDASYSNSIPGDSSDYPIISVDAAYQKLKSGDAFLFYTGRETSISITDVGLGYYIGENQEYFLPIYVFTGNGFTAYVNALPSQ